MIAGFFQLMIKAMADFRNVLECSQLLIEHCHGLPDRPLDDLMLLEPRNHEI